MHAHKVGNLMWLTTLGNSDLSLDPSLIGLRFELRKLAKLVSTRCVQSCTLLVQPFYVVRCVYRLSTYIVLCRLDYFGLEWGWLSWDILGHQNSWVGLLRFCWTLWEKAHERDMAQFGKLGHIWALDGYFGFWAFVHLDWALALGQVRRRVKRSFTLTWNLNVS